MLLFHTVPKKEKP